MSRTFIGNPRYCLHTAKSRELRGDILFPAATAFFQIPNGVVANIRDCKRKYPWPIYREILLEYPWFQRGTMENNACSGTRKPESPTRPEPEIWWFLTAQKSPKPENKNPTRPEARKSPKSPKKLEFEIFCKLHKVFIDFFSFLIQILNNTLTNYRSERFCKPYF